MATSGPWKKQTSPTAVCSLFLGFCRDLALCFGGLYSAAWPATLLGMTRVCKDAHSWNLCLPCLRCLGPLEFPPQTPCVFPGSSPRAPPVVCLPALWTGQGCMEGCGLGRMDWGVYLCTCSGPLPIWDGAGAGRAGERGLEVNKARYSTSHVVGLLCAGPSAGTELPVLGRTLSTRWLGELASFPQCWAPLLSRNGPTACSDIVWGASAACPLACAWLLSWKAAFTMLGNSSGVRKEFFKVVGNSSSIRMCLVVVMCL